MTFSDDELDIVLGIEREPRRPAFYTRFSRTIVNCQFTFIELSPEIDNYIKSNYTNGVSFFEHTSGNLYINDIVLSDITMRFK